MKPTHLLLAGALLAAAGPAPARRDLDILVTLTGPHAGTYTGQSSASCVDTPGGLVAGYMPAVTEQGLRSFRLVARTQAPAGTDDFALLVTLARRNVVYATYTLDPQQGSGTGTLRTTRGDSSAVLAVSGTAEDGTRITVRVRCSTEGDAPIVADADVDATTRDADAEADATAEDSTAAPQSSTLTDDEATRVAGRVELGGEELQAALAEAVRKAGLGAVVDSADLAMMTANAGSELRVPLGAVGRALAAVSPRISPASAAEAMVRELRRHAAGNDQPLRFWARFIAALGGDHQAAFAGRADSLSLGPLQLAMLLERLELDALAVEARAGVGDAGDAFERPSRRPSGPSAAWPVTAPRALDGAPPCRLGEAERTAVDYGATTITTAFGYFVGAVENDVAAVGTWGTVSSITNIIAGYAKLIATLSNLEAEMTFVGERPLQRTRSNIRDGDEVRTVETRLRLPKMESSLMVNCFRPLLNLAGLDFSVDDGGPVADASVSFTIVEGGTVVNRDGGPEYAMIKFLRAGDQKTTTDADGKAAIRITGAKQPREVSQSAREWPREASIGASVRLTKSSLFKDLPGVVGLAASGPIALIAGIPEVMSRSHLPVQSLRVPVLDWVDGISFRLVATGLEWGNQVCDEGTGKNGVDQIEGFVPDTAEYGDGIRVTSVPICGGRPKLRRCRQFEGCGMTWDGDDKVCRMRLDGSQRLKVAADVADDPEHGRVLRVGWMLEKPEHSEAKANGDCLASRWGNEFAPDNEFIVETKEEVVAAYNGFNLRLEDRRPPWSGYEDGAIFRLPAGGRRPLTLRNIDRYSRREGDWTITIW